MKTEDLYKVFKIGQSIGISTIVDITSDLDESYLQPGMRGEIVNMIDKGDYYEVYVVLEAFESYNDKFDKKIWYDRVGWPNLTGKEAGFYPENHVESVYLNYDQDVPFDIVENTTFHTDLFELYLKDGIDKGRYNEWLENIIKKLTDGDVNIIKETLK